MAKERNLNEASQGIVFADVVANITEVLDILLRQQIVSYQIAKPIERSTFNLTLKADQVLEAVQSLHKVTFRLKEDLNFTINI